MSNPLARLLAPAEAALADAARNLAARIAEPIRAKGQEVVAEVVGTATATIRVLVIKAVLGLIGAVMLIVALIFGLAALYWWLLPQLGPVEARLVIAGGFAAIAVIALLAAAFWPKAKPPTKPVPVDPAPVAPEPVQRAMQGDTGGTDAPSAGDVPQPDLARGAEALAAILGDAGMRREQAGLRAGLALASQLKPMQIVALALIGGYVAGVRFGSGRSGRD